MFVNFETREIIDFEQLQVIFPDVSFPPVVENFHLSDKLPLFVVLEYDPEPVTQGLDGYGPGPLREEDGRIFQTWVIMPASDEEWVEWSTRKLNNYTRKAGEQIQALNTRISALNFAINGQDPEDPDYEPATPEEIAELPIDTALLYKWNAYNRNLGKVKTQAGWPRTPTWPVEPALYVDPANPDATNSVAIS